MCCVRVPLKKDVKFYFPARLVLNHAHRHINEHLNMNSLFLSLFFINSLAGREIENISDVCLVCILKGIPEDGAIFYTRSQVCSANMVLNDATQTAKWHQLR